MRSLGRLFRNSYHSFENWRSYSNSRKKAHKLRKGIVEQKETSYVDRKLLKKIKEYANSTFGSPAYWPWLALYTEVREDFKEGWIPDDYYRFELIPKLNPQPMSLLSTIKSFDCQLFEDFAVDPVIVKISNLFFDKDLNEVNKHDVLKQLKSVKTEIIIKIDGGPSGKGHIFLDSDNIDLSVFEEVTNCVVQPVVKQHDNLNELYNQSVNTLRITTLLSEDGIVDDKYVILRFGSGGDRIDNLRSGGYFLFVDRSGHIVSPAYDKNSIERGEKHPDTGFEYKTLTVPSVSEAVENCKKYHLNFPYTKLIAWDVYIDENRKPNLIEWNAKSPDMWCIEALVGPLFLNK